MTCSVPSVAARPRHRLSWNHLHILPFYVKKMITTAQKSKWKIEMDNPARRRIVAQTFAVLSYPAKRRMPIAAAFCAPRWSPRWKDSGARLLIYVVAHRQHLHAIICQTIA